MDLVLIDAEFFAYQKSNIDHVAEKAKTSVNSQNQFPAKSFECGLGSGTRSLRDPRSNYGSRNFSNYWGFRRVCCLFSHSYGRAAVGQAERNQTHAMNEGKHFETSRCENPEFSWADFSPANDASAYARVPQGKDGSSFEIASVLVSSCFSLFSAQSWHLSACPTAAHP